MRILHVVHDFLPLACAGVEVYTYNLAREQARHHEVAVFHASFIPGATNYSLRRGTLDRVSTFEAVNNRLYRSFAETWRNPRMEAIFGEVLAEFRPDAVHVQHLTNHSVEYVDLANRAGARTVFTLHDFHPVCPAGGQLLFMNDRICPGPSETRCPACYAASPLHLGPAERAFAGTTFAGAVPLAREIRKRFPKVIDGTMGLTRKIGSLLRPPARWRLIRGRNDAMLAAVGRCHSVLSPSRFLGRSLQAFGMTCSFIHSDYGFVPPATGRKSSGRQSRASTPFRVGFLGPVTRHKGLEVLLRAAAIAGPGIEVHVCGSEAVDPTLAARLKMESASNAVFHGPYGPDRLDAVMSKIDLLAVPSLWPENSPLVIHEAFLRGVPVAASHIGGIPELVEEGVSGFLFPPGDVEKLAHILRKGRAGARVAARPPKVKTIRENARELEALYRG